MHCCVAASMRTLSIGLVLVSTVCLAAVGTTDHLVLLFNPQVAGPSIYRVYLAAAQRLGLSDGAAGYWELHIREDERHGRQMVEDVALPLVDRCAGGITAGSNRAQPAVLAPVRPVCVPLSQVMACVAV